MWPTGWACSRLFPVQSLVVFGIAGPRHMSHDKKMRPLENGRGTCDFNSVAKLGHWIQSSQIQGGVIMS